MGCGAAKSAIDVLPADDKKKPIGQIPKSLNSKPVLKPIPRKDAKTTDESDSTKSDRPNSTSSHDSGFADNEYKNVITEKSNPELVKKVETEFKERQNLDLAISGKGVTQLISNKEQQRKDQADEMKSLQMLKSNGLVPLTVAKKENYVVFDIIDEKLARTTNAINNLDNPNSKLAPLKKVPPRFLKDKEKNLITPEQIAEKLERANQRKMQQTQLKLNAINEINDPRDSYQQPNHYHTKPMRAQEQIPTSFDPEVYERQKKLIEMRDRIREHNLQSGTPTPRTPRTQELLSELDKFRSKTPSNFKAVFD